MASRSFCGNWSTVLASASQRVGTGGSGDLLQLRYPDGNVASYRLESNAKGHTLLDGDRWFVVSYAECDDL